MSCFLFNFLAKENTKQQGQIFFRFDKKKLYKMLLSDLIKKKKIGNYIRQMGTFQVIIVSNKTDTSIKPINSLFLHIYFKT